MTRLREPGVPPPYGTNGECEYYRVVMPFAHLYDRGHTVGWTPLASLKGGLKVPAMANWDVIVLPRIGLDNPQDRRAFLAEIRAAGKALVYELDDELDDDLEAIPPQNANYQSIIAAGRLDAMYDRRRARIWILTASLTANRVEIVSQGEGRSMGTRPKQENRLTAPLTASL